MCGLVGYIGSRTAPLMVFEGLNKLEYRGYDSAGIATLQQGEIVVQRDEGSLSNLAGLLFAHPVNGHVAMGYIHRAPHGPPWQRNGHPHCDQSGCVAAIQNGIVENYLELRQQLQKEGHTFRSDTDTEVIVHLVDSHLVAGCDLVEAGRRAFQKIKGGLAIVLMSKHEPEKLVAARLGHAGGVIIGLARGETFIASHIPAILEFTQRMIFLEDGEIAVVARDGASFMNLAGAPIEKAIPI